MTRSLWIVFVLLVAANLPTTPAPSPRGAMAPPIWTAGDYWDYLATSTGFPQGGSMRFTVAGSDTVVVGGISYLAYRVAIDASFVFLPPTTGWATFAGTAWYRTADLALVKSFVNETDFVPPNRQVIYSTLALDPPESLQWPLAVGIAWVSSGWVNASWFVPGAGTTWRNNSVDMSFTVESERTVTVPAGSIPTTPVNGTFGGYSNVTYWSPVVGNGVLIQTFAPTGNEIQRLELIGYNYRARAPVTTLVVGAPSYSRGFAYVTSATPLSFSVLDQTGIGVRDTRYRIDGGAWVNYTATGPFHLLSEGTHNLDWFSEDNAGNAETTTSRLIAVDNTPPTTTVGVGDPKYPEGPLLYVTSATNVSLVSTDEGLTPIGPATLEYRLDGGAWTAYATSFNLSGPDGAHALDYRATDLLGNTANSTLNLALDDTPPQTTIVPSAGALTADTNFNLAATDAGSGVNEVEYRVDGGDWTPFLDPFSLPAGSHVIGYRSTDQLGNEEAEHTLSVSVGAGGNWKPLVAAIFAAVLAVVGAIASRRRPWKGGTSRRAMRAAFAIVSLPFVLAEVTTGVLSAVTGQLSIPPILGVGMAVDGAILAAGLAAALLRVRGPRQAMGPPA